MEMTAPRARTHASSYKPHKHLGCMKLAWLLKAAIVAEVGAAVGGYYVFHRFNTDVQFRTWLGQP